METTTNRSWADLPTELRAMVIHHVADIPSLYNLVLADPSTEAPLQYLLPTMLPAILARSMSFEIQSLVYMILAIQTAGKVPGGTVQDLLQSSRDVSGSRHIWEAQVGVVDPKSALRTIVHTGRAVEYFTRTFARCVCQPPTTASQRLRDNNSPLSAAEIHRIHRALWRLEVSSALWKSWLPSYSPSLVSSDERTSRLMLFLKQLNPWEMEELHCVHGHLERLLDRDFHDPRIDRYGQVVSSDKLPAPVFHSLAPGQTQGAANAERVSRGLASLYQDLRRTPLRTRMNDRCYVSHPTDVFVMSAIYRLKGTQERFPWFIERNVSINSGPWIDNLGTTTANAGWRFFTNLLTDRLHLFAFLRQFSFCIWDEPRLRSWGVLDYRYMSGLNKQLMPIWYPWVSTEQSTQYSNCKDRWGGFELDRLL
ncbi:hypothetical protein MMC11_008359 [Xylographa trunciseda]|nr:hypothetical protein [Xylographa trunciseda]